MIKKNHTLKLKLWKAGITMGDLSNKTGIPRPYISMLVNGRYVADQNEKGAIAEALGCDVQEVFPEVRA